MNECLKEQLNRFMEGDELIFRLTSLPDYKVSAVSIVDRMQALMDVYKIFIPNKQTIEIYNRMYLAVLGALDKKDTLDEVQLFNNNFRSIRGYNRYGIIGGFDSFKITGNAGLGKSASIQRCSNLIANRRVLINEKPYREIIPVLDIECVADGSFKSLLFSILQKVDSIIGTNYFEANNRSTSTIDLLLSVTSNVLINHVCLLVIDEIERVANDSRKGDTLINYLTQLVNQSNISICFVGNEISNKYFQTKEYMSRRTIGMSIKKMNYDNEFCDFVKTIFRYQYTLNKVLCSSEYIRIMYELTNGIPSMVISLFVEAQRNAILSGTEELTIELLENTFKNNFSNMFNYIEKSTNIINHRSISDNIVRSKSKETNLIEQASKYANRDLMKAIDYLTNEIAIEYIDL